MRLNNDPVSDGSSLINPTLKQIPMSEANGIAVYSINIFIPEGNSLILMVGYLSLMNFIDFTVEKPLRILFINKFVYCIMLMYYYITFIKLRLMLLGFCYDDLIIHLMN